MTLKYESSSTAGTMRIGVEFDVLVRGADQHCDYPGSDKLRIVPRYAQIWKQRR